MENKLMVIVSQWSLQGETEEEAGVEEALRQKMNVGIAEKWVIGKIYFYNLKKIHIEKI